MLKICKDQWNKNREKLFNVLKERTCLNNCEYLEIVKILFNTLFNEEEDCEIDKLNTREIIEINNGDYQGTLMYIIPFDKKTPTRI